MATHALIADDNGECLAQALFTVVSQTRVRVLALIGCTQYVDREMDTEEARAEYRRLLDAGWTIPLRTEVLSASTLKLHIYG